MLEIDTAPLCHNVARSRAKFPGLTTLIAAAIALCALVLAPVASAHGRRPSVRRCKFAHTKIPAARRSQLQRAVVCLINQQRRYRGLPRLRASGRLNRSAQGWTNVMVSDRYFSHGADFSARISAVGFDWSNAAENIATGYKTPAAVVRAWMASTGHCQNILSPLYREVGTGVSNHAITGFSSRAGTWTQDFGLLMGQHSASANWAPADACPYG